MNADNFLDSEYVEYIVIGAHTLVWVVALIIWLSGVPLSQLQQVTPISLVVLLPFTFVFGLMFDSVSQFLIRPLRHVIKRLVLGKTWKRESTDEYLAIRSPDLYLAYETRMKRTRIMGASVFNWLLLGGVLAHYTASLSSREGLILAGSTVLLVVLSLLSWIDHTRRAYALLREALKVVSSEDDTQQAHAQIPKQPQPISATPKPPDVA